MMRFSRTICIAALVAVFACVAVAQTAAGKTTFDAKHFSSLIEKITTGVDSDERRVAILTELAALKVSASTESFTRKNRDGQTVTGTNIIAEVSNPNAKRTIMIGAHFDRVAKGKGAIDNASGSAAVLMLLKAFKASPMKNINLQAAFWDHEEMGLHGSRIYVENRRENGLPAMYINFDVFGYGDTLWLWSPAETNEFAAALRDTATALKFSSQTSSVYPPSDHHSFNNGGVDSYSFSLLPAAEVTAILKVLGGENVKPENFPAVLKTIHTDNDTKDKIDAAAVVKSLPTVETAIRKLDK